VHTQAVFADPAVVAQAGGAIVAGAGGDLCESVAHVFFLKLQHSLRPGKAEHLSGFAEKAAAPPVSASPWV
jgi:hypothetical protein